MCSVLFLPRKKNGNAFLANAVSYNMKLDKNKRTQYEKHNLIITSSTAHESKSQNAEH